MATGSWLWAQRCGITALVPVMPGLWFWPHSTGDKNGGNGGTHVWISTGCGTLKKKQRQKKKKKQKRKKKKRLIIITIKIKKQKKEKKKGGGWGGGRGRRGRNERYTKNETKPTIPA